MDLNLNKREFKDAVQLRYDWQISDLPNIGICGEPFYVDNAMICKWGGFIIQRHNELRNLEAQMLKTGLSWRWSWTCCAADYRWVVGKGELIQPRIPGLTFMHGVFGLDRVQHSLTCGCATQMRNLTKTSPLSKSIATMRTKWVMEVEQATFTPLVFTTTGGMAPECQVYHKRLAELLWHTLLHFDVICDLLDARQHGIYLLNISSIIRNGICCDHTLIPWSHYWSS